MVRVDVHGLFLNKTNISDFKTGASELSGVISLVKGLSHNEPTKLVVRAITQGDRVFDEASSYIRRHQADAPARTNTHQANAPARTNTNQADAPIVGASR